MENDNFGDTLIADTTRKILEKKGYIVEDYEVGSAAEEIISFAQEYDFLLFAGGGIIERYIPLILRRFSEYIDKLGLPYGVMGLSVGNFNYDYKSISLGRWVDNAAFFYTRDQRSADILNSYSATKKAKCSGDCVFLTDMVKNSCVSPYGKIGINVRNLPYKDLTGELDWNQILTIIKRISIEMVIMDSSEEITNILTGKDLSRYEEYIQKGKIEKVKQIIAEIEECRIVVAMRYHVILIAALLGIPTISIKYCPKVETLVEQLGISDIAVDVGDYEGIVQKYNYLCCHYDEYRSKILENVPKLKNRVKEMYEDVIEHLDNFC
jgi:polysaccharide pyruvyl transferase WcaK-like protein